MPVGQKLFPQPLKAEIERSPRHFRFQPEKTGTRNGVTDSIVEKLTIRTLKHKKKVKNI